MGDTPRSIHDTLIRKAKTLAVAESCTGGLLSAMLTDNPGSSSYFLLGAVTYSNASKSKLLRIPPSLIRQYGAVSSQVAALMAKGVRSLASADLGVGITGIAGPQGASARKPVGTVYIAASSARRAVCRKFLFKGNRSSIRRQAAAAAIGMLASLL